MQSKHGGECGAQGVQGQRSWAADQGAGGAGDAPTGSMCWRVAFGHNSEVSLRWVYWDIDVWFDMWFFWDD